MMRNYLCWDPGAVRQVINPFAGQFYTQSRWVRRLQSNERAIVQATGALQVNLGRWLGASAGKRMSGTNDSDSSAETIMKRAKPDVSVTLSSSWPAPSAP